MSTLSTLSADFQVKYSPSIFLPIGQSSSLDPVIGQQNIFERYGISEISI